MNVWLGEFSKLADLVMGHPGTQVQYVVVALLALGTFLLILTRVGSYMGAPISSAGRSLAILAITVIFWLGGSAAASIYLAPRLSANAGPWLPIAVAVLVVLFISTPCTRLFQRTKYGKGLSLLLLSIAGAIAVSLLVGQAFTAARHGSKEGDVIKGRTNEMNDFLSK